MNKIILATVALATFGVSGVANAKQDPAERAAFYQTVRNETPAPAGAPVIVEGRNAAVAAPAAQGVEPYIAQSVEQDARSTK